jgi:predicted AAA+ superfamily ATPase
VVIDEIQRIPTLLNEVHRQIENNKTRTFLLTGSSARKLRKAGVNLLGGRARTYHLHPLVSDELKDKFDLERALQFGTIPSIYGSEDPWTDLKSYVGTYLKEEIVAEAVTRNIPAFARFLEVAALCCGSLINFEKVSQDAAVPRTTVQNYFQILNDTLIGYTLEPWKRTQTRRPILTPKFYFFDVGVSNYLKRIKTLEDNTPQFGDALETYMFHELKAYADYMGIDSLHFWRSQSGFEVDFLIDDDIAIEVKSSRRVIKDDLKGLLALSEEMTLRRKILVCRETTPRIVEGIEIMYCMDFMKKLWSGEILKK